MQDQQLARQQQPSESVSDGASAVPEAITSPSEQKRDYDYYRDILGSHPMPYAFVDIDLLEQNVREVTRRAAGKHVRLASKSIRSVSILERLFRSSPDCFRGIM